MNKSVFWDPVFRRVRCNGHIINLSAQSFLFPNLPDKHNIVILDAQINGQRPKEFNNAQMKIWRKKGPLGKLNNVSVYITMSTQRVDAFKLISGNKKAIVRPWTKYGLAKSRSHFQRLKRDFQIYPLSSLCRSFCELASGGGVYSRWSKSQVVARNSGHRWNFVFNSNDHVPYNLRLNSTIPFYSSLPSARSSPCRVSIFSDLLSCRSLQCSVCLDIISLPQSFTLFMSMSPLHRPSHWPSTSFL